MATVGFQHVHQKLTKMLASTMNLGFDKTQSCMDDRRSCCDVLVLLLLLLLPLMLSLLLLLLLYARPHALNRVSGLV